jgi:hypothetical protein
VTSDREDGSRSASQRVTSDARHEKCCLGAKSAAECERKQTAGAEKGSDERASEKPAD